MTDEERVGAMLREMAEVGEHLRTWLDNVWDALQDVLQEIAPAVAEAYELFYRDEEESE